MTAALVTARIAGYLSASVAEQNIALIQDDLGLYDARSPAQLASHLNELVIEEMETDCYLTLVYADIDTISGEIRMVQAGHPHPAVQRADGSVEFLGNGGMPIGLIERAEYEEFATRLAPGDRLFLTSDGITEAEDAAGRLLGEDGLGDILRLNAPVAGAALLESLGWSIANYSGGRQADDISAVLVEFFDEVRQVD